jgi:hypothetical protein
VARSEGTLHRPVYWGAPEHLHGRDGDGPLFAEVNEHRWQLQVAELSRNVVGGKVARCRGGEGRVFAVQATRPRRMNAVVRPLRRNT